MGWRQRALGAQAMLLAAGPALSQYEPPRPAPDPAAQLAEMLGIYQHVCLEAFPDDAAVAGEMRSRGGVALSEAEVGPYLRDDPGRGWRIAGRSAPFVVTVEAPPYHACTVRTTTTAGFRDLSSYRALVDDYEEGRAFQPIDPLDGTVGNVRTSLRGETAPAPDGGSDTLMIAVGMASAEVRARGHTAVEVRFVHQFYSGDDGQ